MFSNILIICCISGINILKKTQLFIYESTQFFHVKSYGNKK